MFETFFGGNDYVLHEIGKIMPVLWDKSVLPNVAGRANKAATWLLESGSQSQSRQIEIDTFLCGALTFIATDGETAAAGVINHDLSEPFGRSCIMQFPARCRKKNYSIKLILYN